MLGFLRRDAREAGIANISCRQTTWQDVPDDLQADVVICSHVLYAITEIVFPYVTTIGGGLWEF